MPSQSSCIMVVDDRNQRLAFDDTLRDFGFDVQGCYTSNALPKLIKGSIDKNLVWLVDVSLDAQLQRLIDIHEPKLVLMGFSEAPNLNNAQLYRKWQNILFRRLSHALQLPKHKRAGQYSPPKPWRYVLFLGASMGGPDAVKVFLDNISPELPVAILLAQHFDKAMIHALPKVLTRHNKWRCQVITASQSLHAGCCLVAPIDKQIVCDSEGRVILLDKPWVGEYQPNISAILKNVSDVYGGELISIIFSGMGDDGSKYIEDIVQNRSYLWAQSPQSSGCASQPQAMIDTGYCQFVGSPIELAHKINHMLKSVQFSQLLV